MELAGATWPQVEATGARTVLAVPLGSLEQHGPHLPLDTDTRIAVALATITLFQKCPLARITRPYSLES